MTPKEIIITVVSTVLIIAFIVVVGYVIPMIVYKSLWDDFERKLKSKK
ncbi:MAG TPA: hypothetical protein VL443_24025 [Cyclobacteriaceae bacterium]|jgi:hypothetical protein|nr:hypothetical protein [Cyclobacteriaceae bacterium]